MKSIAALLIIGVTFSLQANATTCADKISSLNSKVEVTESQLECLRTDSDFGEATTLLCTENEKDISAEYSQYLSYQKKYQQAFDAYSNENDPRKKGSLLLRVRQADSQWVLAGYRSEVDYALLQFSSALTNCTKN